MYLPGATVIKNLYINYEWPNAFYELHCYGNESSIWDCSYVISDDDSSCAQSDDAAVLCMGMCLIHDVIIIIIIIIIIIQLKVKVQKFIITL